MSANLEALEAEALKLTPADRSHLLTRLMSALSPASILIPKLMKPGNAKQIEGTPNCNRPLLKQCPDPRP